MVRRCGPTLLEAHPALEDTARFQRFHPTSTRGSVAGYTQIVAGISWAGESFVLDFPVGGHRGGNLFISIPHTHAAGSDLNPRSVRAGHGFYLFVFHVPEGAVGVHVDHLPSTVSHVFFMVAAALNVGPGAVGVVNFYPGFVGAVDGVVRARARLTGLIIIGESS